MQLLPGRREPFGRELDPLALISSTVVHRTRHVALSTLLLFSMLPIAAAQEAVHDVRALFSFNCASCHGEKGDGLGVTKLDRAARSFKDGGFSYGNTPEALLRTITQGIPGTVMPSFASALSDADRRALAEYVITLGPETIHVDAKETVMIAGDRALCVRGKLPPIVENAPERPRGLLIGTPDGKSFEFRTDDVRLLGVRQGAFVDRRDWVGRGGDPLAPLGRLVYVFGNGDPGATFEIAKALDEERGSALAAQFTGTSMHGARASLAYRLSTAAQHAALLRVDESLCGFTSKVGAGFVRQFDIRDAQTPSVLFVRAAEAFGTKAVATGILWIVRSRADGMFEAQLARGLHEHEGFALGADALRLKLAIDAKEKRSVEVATLILPVWNDAIAAQWMQEINR